MAYNGNRAVQKLRQICRSGGAFKPRGTRQSFKKKTQEWGPANAPSKSQAEIFMEQAGSGEEMKKTLKFERERMNARKERRKERSSSS